MARETPFRVMGEIDICKKPLNRDDSIHKGQDVIWGLHTRACKYDLSALETYFECEGVKPTNLNFN